MNIKPKFELSVPSKMILAAIQDLEEYLKRDDSEYSHKEIHWYEPDNKTVYSSLAGASVLIKTEHSGKFIYHSSCFNFLLQSTNAVNKLRKYEYGLTAFTEGDVSKGLEILGIEYDGKSLNRQIDPSKKNFLPKMKKLAKDLQEENL